MPTVRNSRVVFVETPLDFPVPGKHAALDDSHTINPDSVPLNGGFLLKTLVLGVDPYVDLLMKTAYRKGEPIFSLGVGVVLRTENSSVKAGDHVYGMLPFEEYSVIPDVKSIDAFDSFRILENTEKLPWSVYVGLVGVAGQTAYMGWKEFADPQEGDTVFVTTGAGPVGSCVIQMAKQAGLKVIASAGSEEKVQFMKEIGADVTFNYKTTSTEDVLKREGPINIYWDNVGGEILDIALGNSAKGARFIECGMISTMIGGQPPAMKNLPFIFRSELKIYGLYVTSLMPKYLDQFYAEVPKLVAEGKFKCFEEIRHGLAHAEQAILDVLKGRNQGKMVIAVGEDL